MAEGREIAEARPPALRFRDHRFAGYHGPMSLREPAGLDPADSSLAELDPLAATLAEAGGEARREGPAFLGVIPNAGAEGYRPERVVGEADFLPVCFLRLGAARARAVCHLEYELGGRAYVGTGFMVSDELLLTNHHVFPSAEAARGARAFFDYEADERGRQLSPSVFLAQPERCFLTNARLDFSLVAVDQRPGARWGVVPLRYSPPGLRPGQRVNIVQHPRGQLKQIVVQGNRVVEVGEVALKYEADTEGGSSGAPVFNQSWDLIALHHLGGQRDNVGVRSDRILKYLAVAATEGAGGPLLRALLERVPDSGELGWFATAGLEPPDRAARVRADPPEERVALDWVGGAEFLDLAHWDLGPVFALDGVELGEAEDPARDRRLAELAGLLDTAGADLFVLEGLAKAAHEVLAAAVAEQGQHLLSLGERAAVVLDAHVQAELREPSEVQRELLAGTVRGAPVVPGPFTQLALRLERPGQGGARSLVAHLVELDPGRALPSRSHKNELARVLRALAEAVDEDVVTLGRLAPAFEQPALRAGDQPPELCVLAGPEGGHGSSSSIAWIGDGRGADLEAVYTAKANRGVHFDEAVARHVVTRELPIPASLAAAGAPLMLRARFGELERPAPAEAPAESPGARRRIEVDAHVQSIEIIDAPKAR